jgi:outer membrane protein assembly factor BamA
VVEEVLIRGAEKIYAKEEGVDEQLLHSELEVRSGQVFRKQRAEGDRKRLLQLYRERGFVDARNR